MEADGNIFLCEADGSFRQLIDLGLDASPAVSPNGRGVAFVQTIRASGVGTPTDSRIMFLDAPSGVPREIARNGSAPGRECLSMRAPVFAFDDLILVDAAGLNIPRFDFSSVCAIRLRSKQPQVGTLAMGAECVVAIVSGRDQGRLFAYGQVSTRTNPTAGYFRVVDRTGRTLRELDIDTLDTTDLGEGARVGAYEGSLCRSRGPSRGTAPQEP